MISITIKAFCPKIVWIEIENNIKNKNEKNKIKKMKINFQIKQRHFLFMQGEHISNLIQILYFNNTRGLQFKYQFSMCLYIETKIFFIFSSRHHIRYNLFSLFVLNFLIYHFLSILSNNAYVFQKGSLDFLILF